MMLVGFGAAVAGIFLAPFAVPALFGSDYRAAVPVVQIMLFVIPFVYASTPLLVQLYTSGNERKVLGATLLASLVGTTAILVGQASVRSNRCGGRKRRSTGAVDRHAGSESPLRRLVRPLTWRLSILRKPVDQGTGE